MNYYSDKALDYYKNVRFDIISLVPQNKPLKVLEIGAGACNTLAFLKEKKIATEVIGIELFSIPNSMQQSDLIDKLYITDIEKGFPQLEYNHFDVIILGDVLEHLIDPWTIASKLKDYLKEDGIVITSLPNFRDFSVLYKVFLKGDFGYTESGIMDKTHMRFFCLKNMENLLKTSNLKIKSVHEAFKLAPKTSIRGIVNTLTLGLFSEFLTSQYLIVCTK